ncbi:AAA family ATPase [Flammeovirgaceae bacterium SG7u.111]|nr:AAA family ATPase [Flammeovirgaceae bacterium SG7u.132]WPO37063.1 AAA family ATPase [Flammeovirgaceae bacterium SG7u.111]
MVRRIVITGGPGAGKTTLINKLQSLGYIISEEVSRKLIQQESSKKKGLLPWENLPAFALLCCKEMATEWEHASQNPSFVFFDRGMPDILAYLRCNNLPDLGVKKSILSHPYYTTVFWCPPWEEVYVNDPERPQSYTEAFALGTAIQKVYIELGYKVIELPKTTVETRAEMIFSELSS